jgi:hypothetical protein
MLRCLVVSSVLLLVGCPEPEPVPDAPKRWWELDMEPDTEPEEADASAQEDQAMEPDAADAAPSCRPTSLECECFECNECCDGCAPRPFTQYMPCFRPDPTDVGGSCNGIGQCIPNVACNCQGESACCDGCKKTPANTPCEVENTTVVCRSNVRVTVEQWYTCGGENFCPTGARARDNMRVFKETKREPCGVGEWCVERPLVKNSFCCPEGVYCDG